MRNPYLPDGVELRPNWLMIGARLPGQSVDRHALAPSPWRPLLGAFPDIAGDMTDAQLDAEIRAVRGKPPRRCDRCLVEQEQPPMTPSERAAWREGVSDSVVSLRAMASRIRQRAKGCTYALSNAATLETAADQLAETPPAREPTGLEYRAG